MKFYRKKTTKTYYTIVGGKTTTNLYGKKGSFTKELMTDGNGRKFMPHISETNHIQYSDWDKIKESDLPKGLQASFNSFKDWL